MPVLKTKEKTERNQMTASIATVKTTGITRTETISPRGKDPYNILVELLDLYLPGKRHPAEITRRVESENDKLDPSKTYLIGGDCFEIGRYDRLEFNSYGIEFIEVDKAIDELTSPSETSGHTTSSFGDYSDTGT